MNTATMALVFGVAFSIIGVLGFFPSPPDPAAPPLTFDHGHGMVLGLFPVNTLHNVAHLLFGMVGIAAASGILLSARAYFQLIAVAYALLAILGVIPGTQTAFGFIPLWGNDVWLHAAIAAVAAYFGFAAPVAVAPRRV